MIRIVFPDLGGCRVDVVKIAKKIEMCKPLPKKKLATGQLSEGPSLDVFGPRVLST